MSDVQASIRKAAFSIAVTSRDLAPQQQEIACDARAHTSCSCSVIFKVERNSFGAGTVFSIIMYPGSFQDYQSDCRLMV